MTPEQIQAACYHLATEVMGWHESSSPYRDWLKKDLSLACKRECWNPFENAEQALMVLEEFPDWEIQHCVYVDDIASQYEVQINGLFPVGYDPCGAAEKLSVAICIAACRATGYEE